MLKQWLLLLFMTLFTLSACNSPVYQQTEMNIADVKLKQAAMRKKSDDDARPPPPLVLKRGMYVDTTPISIAATPAWLRNRIVIRGDQLPFSYYSRTIANGATETILTKYQVDLDPSLRTSLNYTGTVKGALDLLASKTGYVYTVHGHNVYWQAFLTRTFDIAFMPGSSDYLMGKSSGGNSGTANTGSQGAQGTVSNYVSTDYSDSEFSNLKGTLSVWKDLEATLTQLISPQGKFKVSEATTSVTVRDRPTNLDLIAQFINNLNHKLSRQVLVKIQILEVNLENDFEWGINWDVILKAFNNTNWILHADYGTPTSITALTPQFNAAKTPSGGLLVRTPGKTPSYTILLNALNQQAKTSIVNEPRVVCLNNQVSVIRITESQGYAASVQNTSLTGTTGGTSQIGTVTSQITPGTVVTGITLYILPKILGDKIYMQVNADLSTLNALTPFGPGGTTNPTQATIQLPDVTSKDFNQRAMLHSGDTLILAGMRTLQNTANANQFITSQALGGKGSIAKNNETIVLITPIILTGHA